MHPNLDFGLRGFTYLNLFALVDTLDSTGAQLTDNHYLRGKGGYRRTNSKKNNMEVCQNLPFASNACNPFVRAFAILGALLLYRGRKRERERESDDS